MGERFSYTRGYNYREFAELCDRFRTVKLNGFPYAVASVVSEYVFGYSMQRFPTRKKNVLRRFAGTLFCYPVTVTGTGKTAFLFSGDGVGRPDYLQCLQATAAQCDSPSLWVLDRTRPRLRIANFFGPIRTVLWALKLKKITGEFMIALDFAAGLYRAKKQGESIFRQLQNSGIQKLVTFCDAWSIESVVTQLANGAQMPTATLQHGNGTEIFYGSCSNYYLANSLLSRENCLTAGIPSEKIVVAGPMKYAGQAFTYRNTTEIRNLGVVFDGAQNFENNVQMVKAVREAIAGTDIRCHLRFHPNNRRKDYAPYLQPSDVICDDLAEFERTVDLCVVYNSSMFTDMIYKHIPVIRFKNGKVDLFPQVQDEGFENAETLRNVLAETSADEHGYAAKQAALYRQVFGEECGEDGYRRFFCEKM